MNHKEKKQPCFKNKLQRIQNMKKLQRHRAQLFDIAKSTQKDFIVRQPYKQLLQRSLKPNYLKDIRDIQVKRQNFSLGKRIHQIQTQTMGQQKMQQHNYSKSLNMLKRKDEFKKIRAQNRQFAKRINAQRPFLTNENLSKISSIQENLAFNISKQQKYKLPDINNNDLVYRYSSISSFNKSGNDGSSRIKLQLSLNQNNTNDPPV